MKINEKLYKDIVQYCEYNNISDIDEEINKYIQIGFNVVRFGATPFQEYNEEKVKITKIEKEEIISEKIEKPLVNSSELPKKNKIRIIKNK